MSKFLGDDKEVGAGRATSLPTRASAIFQRLSLGKTTSSAKASNNSDSGSSSGKGGRQPPHLFRSSKSVEEEKKYQGIGGGGGQPPSSQQGQQQPPWGFSTGGLGAYHPGGHSGVALPGHLKMKVRGSPDGDPAPSRPRGMGPGALGGLAVSRLAHSHSQSSGGGSAESSPVTSHFPPSLTSGATSGLKEYGSPAHGRVLNIDLTSEGGALSRDQRSSLDRRGGEDEDVEASSSGSSSSAGDEEEELMGGAPPEPPVVKPYIERKFDELLAEDVMHLKRLRELSWGGIPERYRGTIWRLLLGYLPANRDRREVTLKRKRKEYADILPMYLNIPAEDRTMQEQEILRQIQVDLPRTQPELPLFHQDPIQRCMERILYVWAIRHPASGYVQGMNDLITPLILVFLAEHLGTVAAAQENDLSSSGGGGGSTRQHHAEAVDVSRLGTEALAQIEADVYWCITKLLDNIQDHYTFSQPGLQRMIFRLSELVERHDPSLHRHLDDEGLQYVQFAFRWMNCLLMRELSLDAVIRIWDTELSEENGFEVYHVYLCAAFLLRFSDQLKTLPFQELVLFLQDPPTHDWVLHDIEPLLSQAHVLRSLYPPEGSALTR